MCTAFIKVKTTKTKMTSLSGVDQEPANICFGRTHQLLWLYIWAVITVMESLKCAVKVDVADQGSQGKIRTRWYYLSHFKINCLGPTSLLGCRGKPKFDQLQLQSFI